MSTRNIKIFNISQPDMPPRPVTGDSFTLLSSLKNYPNNIEELHEQH
jgi:hypothetical protein